VEYVKQANLTLTGFLWVLAVGQPAYEYVVARPLGDRISNCTQTARPSVRPSVRLVLSQAKNEKVGLENQKQT